MCWRLEAFSFVTWELEAAMRRTAELAAGAAPRATFRQANGNDRNVTKVLWTALFESR